MQTIDANDLVDPLRYAEEGRPWELWKRLRREAPVARCESAEYAPFWAITRHADILAISRDPERFCSAEGITLLRRDEPDFQRAIRTIINMDPPDHGPYRAVGSRWFIPRNLKTLEDSIRALVREILDGIATSGEKKIDFVAEVATALPLRLICGLLGIPPEDESFALRVANEAFGSDDPELQRADGGREALVFELFGYLTSLLGERKAAPREDLLSVIANAEVNGQPIPDLEALSYGGLILGAGIDTTRCALGSGIVALLEHRGELERLRRDPALIPTAVDELLRWTTPANQMLRTATQDCEVSGVTVAKGETVVLFYPSANRDEDVFDEPERFCVDRKPNQHLTFGFGEHFCLGAGLAKMEIRVLLEELLPRLRAIEPAGRARPIRTNFIVGYKEVPVAMELAPAAS